MKTIKHKKQFRLYDIYRYAAIGEQSSIQGIDSYECNRDATTLVVRFTNYGGELNSSLACNFFATTETDLKQIVKEINVRLGNCMKPGPRR